MPLKHLTLRETILEYLKTANEISPTILQSATKGNWINNYNEIDPSPIVCSCDKNRSVYSTSGLGLINGLLLYCNEQVITFTTNEDQNDPTILKIE